MLLEIHDLTISITSGGRPFDAVDRVSISIPKGSVVALVGESGCGKSLTALSILQLLPKPHVGISGGRVIWNPGDGDAPTPSREIDLLRISGNDLRTIRGRDIAMIFQEPMTALNPVFRVGEQIAEVLVVHRGLSPKDALAEAGVLMTQVGIDHADLRLHDYPHQFSGGMRQRVLIAMALAGKPSLLIADEPTTALDVTVQAQILDLLRTLQMQTGMSILLITHDLGVVAQMADYVYVMYAGRIVEHASTESLFAAPAHPYTQSLFRCTPRLHDAGSHIEAIRGSVPEPAAFPPGCRFHPRCDLARQQAKASGRHVKALPDGEQVLRRCVEAFEQEDSGEPRLREMEPGHFVACWEA